MNLRTLLDEIKETNPTMDKKKLIEELAKSETSARVLIAMCGNNKKSDRLQEVS